MDRGGGFVRRERERGEGRKSRRESPFLSDDCEERDTHDSEPIDTGKDGTAPLTLRRKGKKQMHEGSPLFIAREEKGQ